MKRYIKSSILNYNYTDDDLVPAKIDTWYDRHSRSWIVRVIDDTGNQIGDAEYCGTKSDRDWSVRMLKEKYNL